MKSSVIFSVLLVHYALATPAPAPASNQETFTRIPVDISPDSKVIGRFTSGTEQFNGIPFADPPIGPLRLTPPRKLSRPPREINGIPKARACPQMLFSEQSKNVIAGISTKLLKIPFFQELNGHEDCLTLDVTRPAGTKAGDKLPVLAWIFGGGFAVGSTQSWDPRGLLKFSSSIRQPFIFVAINYRVGGFGFMPGKEILDDGSANLGLLDQRMGLEWVADNIESFGGDRSKVTLWGGSAGAISIVDHMVLNDGDATYKGQPLFRGAILSSGSIVPADPVDCPKGQAVYDQVVQEAGCSNVKDTLNCLRELPFEQFLAATRVVPTLFSFDSEAVSYFPRPDGRIYMESPDKMIAEGRYHAVPLIIGSTEDEGTLFSMHQTDANTAENMVDYMSKNLFRHFPKDNMREYIDLYEPAVTKGSPFRTGAFNNLYPGYKRVAAIIGDVLFSGMRRVTLKAMSKARPRVPLWSYLATIDHGFPFVGTYHGADGRQLFGRILRPSHFVRSSLTYYANFVYNLDPNEGVGNFAFWPLWQDKHQLLLFRSRFRNGLVPDDFRREPIGWIERNLKMFYV